MAAWGATYMPSIRHPGMHLAPTQSPTEHSASWVQATQVLLTGSQIGRALQQSVLVAQTAHSGIEGEAQRWRSRASRQDVVQVTAADAELQQGLAGP